MLTLYEKVEKTGFRGIIRRMARLRDQKRMVKKLYYFFNSVDYTNPTSRGVRLENLSRDAIPDKDFSGLIATRMTIKDRIVNLVRPDYFGSEKYQFQRAYKNNRLYKSCVDDGFIEPVTEEIRLDQDLKVPVHRGIRVSNKGTNLIHFLGFWEIVFKTYPLTWSVAIKLFLGLTGGGTGAYIVIKLVRHYIFSLPF